MEVFGAINVKMCDQKTFTHKGNMLETSLMELRDEVYHDAISEEAAIAVEKASVDEDGIPCLPVIIDGAWNKRAFGHGYSASAGCGVILGAETGKVLYSGSKQKRCKACDYGNVDHRCYANWTGPPGGMEGVIIVEGFKEVFEKYNIKFTKVIGDDDSTVFRKIKEEVPYGTQIEKLNCANHATKNLKKALIKVN